MVLAATVLAAASALGAWNLLGTEISGAGSNANAGASVSLTTTTGVYVAYTQQFAEGYTDPCVNETNDAFYKNCYIVTVVKFTTPTDRTTWSKIVWYNTTATSVVSVAMRTTTLLNQSLLIAVAQSPTDETGEVTVNNPVNGIVQLYAVPASGSSLTAIGDPVVRQSTDFTEFGKSVALNADMPASLGPLLIVGQPGTGTGAIQSSRYVDGAWTDYNVIDGTNSGGNFGIDLSVTSGVSLTRAATVDSRLGNATVFVYDFHAGTTAYASPTLVFSALLTDHDAPGYAPSVAISGDGNTVAVGIPSAPIGAASRAGYVQIYRKNATSWANIGRINGTEISELHFGMSTSLTRDGNTIAVGTTGYQTTLAAIYKYRGGTTWVQDFNLTGTALGTDASTSPVRVEISWHGKYLLVGSQKQNSTTGRVWLYGDDTVNHVSHSDSVIIGSVVGAVLGSAIVAYIVYRIMNRSKQPGTRLSNIL